MVRLVTELLQVSEELMRLVEKSIRCAPAYLIPSSSKV